MYNNSFTQKYIQILTVNSTFFCTTQDYFIVRESNVLFTLFV